MNRRTFLRSLLALPFATKAIIAHARAPRSSAAIRKEFEDRINRRLIDGVTSAAGRTPFDDGIKAMLARTNRTMPDYYGGPEQVRQLNEIFAKLYALRK